MHSPPTNLPLATIAMAVSQKAASSPAGEGGVGFFFGGRRQVRAAAGKSPSHLLPVEQKVLLSSSSAEGVFM